MKLAAALVMLVACAAAPRVRTATVVDGTSVTAMWTGEIRGVARDGDWLSTARTGAHEQAITPAELMKYGEVIYWSGVRDDPQVIELASERVQRSIEPRTATTQ